MSLEERVRRHSELFDSFVELIPSKLYLPALMEQDTAVSSSNYFFKSSKFAQKKFTPKSGQAVKEAKQQHRKDKFDPEKHASIADLQKRLKKETESPVSASTETSIQDIRCRLAERIARLQQSRESTKPNTVHNGSSLGGKKSREQILEERKRRKMERKLQIDIEKSTLPMPKPMPSDDSTKRKKDVDEVNSNPGSIAFSKFEFGIEKKKQRLDPKSAMSQVEKQQTELQAIKGKDEEKAAQIEEARKWNKLMSLAKGEKVQDDTKKLARSIKRLEKKKKKSKTVWEERSNKVTETQQARQKKRTENIQKRKDEKLTKKKKAGFK